MSAMAYPTLPINELYAPKARPSLLRWLPLSLAIHLLVFLLFGLELVHLSTEDAALPVKSGQQAISVKLVAAHDVNKTSTSHEDSKTEVKKSTASTVMTQAKAQEAATAKTTASKTKTLPAASKSQAASQTVSLASNLTTGVYSQATPESGNKPDYPRMAILQHQQGKVVIKLDIDETGRSHNIQVVKSSGFDLLDKAVITFAQMERFIPASSNNAPIKTTQQYSFLFKLI